MTKLTQKNKNLLLVTLTLLLFVCLSLVWIRVAQSTTMATDENYTYYYFGNSKTYRKGTKLEKVDEHLILADGNDTKDAPLIGKNSILTTTDMIYYQNNTGELFCLPNLTSVYLEDGVIKFKEDFEIHQTINGNPGFLYDGNRTYIFLQEVNLFVNDKTIRLSPLSFVSYSADGICYFDYDTKSGNAEKLIKDEVIVTCDNYSISMNSAVITNSADVSLLLFTNTSVLQSVYR